MYDEFLGSSDACQMNLWALYMSSVICTYFRMLLDNAFPNLPWNMCRREKTRYASSCPCFEGLCSPCTYQLPYVSNSNWMRQDLHFLLLLSLFTYCNVHSLKHVLSWAEHHNVSFVSLRMICNTSIWCNQILIMKHH